jgi:structural maintenance of chromosome 4
LSAKIEGLDKQIKDSERKVAHWQKEIQQLCKLERQEDIDYDLSDDEGEDEDEANGDGVEETKEEDDDMAAEDNEMTNVDGEEIQAHVPKKKDKMSHSLPIFSDAALEQYSIESIKNDIAVLEKERDSLAKNANMGAIAEYRKKEADYLSR